MASRFTRFANPASLDNFSGVPGLGFDFPHLAAVSSGLNNTPASHFGHHRDHDRGPGFFIPILFGGFPYYPYSYDELGYDQPEQQPIPQEGQQMAQENAQPMQPQPQVIVIQQRARTQQSADAGNDTRELSGSASASAAEAPVPDVGNFILVRRDGRILFASLFSVVGTQLQYVTPEGFRRTLAMSDLDTDATTQMNEARGTTVQLHN